MRSKADKKGKGDIIIRKEEVVGGGHHGGSWKVAYADFVTAMMAFFLLMWLLNATSEEQRKGLADYFSPSATLSHSSSGTGQPFGGRTAFSQGAMLSDLGAVQVTHGQQPVIDNVIEDESDAVAQPRPFRDDPKSTEPNRGGKVDPARAAMGPQDKPMKPGATPPGRADVSRLPTEQELQAALERRERQAFDQAAQQIREAVRSEPALGDFASQLAIDMTPEGLRIQLLDAEREAMFPLGSAAPTDHARMLLQKVAPVIARLTQDISIAGHTDAAPFIGPGRTNWELSADRANATRRLLVDSGLQQSRIRSVTGNAERDPLLPNEPLAAANRRIAIVVLRTVPQLSSPPPASTLSQDKPVPAIQPAEPADGQKWSVQSLKTR